MNDGMIRPDVALAGAKPGCGDWAAAPDGTERIMQIPRTIPAKCLMSIGRFLPYRAAEAVQTGRLGTCSDRRLRTPPEPV